MNQMFIIPFLLADRYSRGSGNCNA